MQETITILLKQILETKPSIRKKNNGEQWNEMKRIHTPRREGCAILTRRWRRRAEDGGVAVPGQVVDIVHKDVSTNELGMRIDPSYSVVWRFLNAKIAKNKAEGIGIALRSLETVSDGILSPSKHFKGELSISNFFLPRQSTPPDWFPQSLVNFPLITPPSIPTFPCQFISPRNHFKNGSTDQTFLHWALCMFPFSLYKLDLFQFSFWVDLPFLLFNVVIWGR